MKFSEMYPSEETTPMTKIFKIKQLTETAQLPEYKTAGASGMDLCADLPGGPVTIQPNQWILIPTGIAIQLEVGFEAQIRSRSGLTLKQGLVVLNAPGTIDSDYIGGVGVILYNFSKDAQKILHGDRIAQMVVAQYTEVCWEVVDELNNTDRGVGGFGSTGK